MTIKDLILESEELPKIHLDTKLKYHGLANENDNEYSISNNYIFEMDNNYTIINDSLVLKQFDYISVRPRSIF